MKWSEYTRVRASSSHALKVVVFPGRRTYRRYSSEKCPSLPTTRFSTRTLFGKRVAFGSAAL